MLPKVFANRPLYQQLRDAIVQGLTSGRWGPGDSLPNEADLAREYGVSTGTVRKALDIMEVEKFVSRHQGRGTIVNDPASGELAVRFSNIRDATGQRIAGVAKTAEAKLSKASKLEIERL
jgi:GntR family transcriptional regulator